MIVTETELTGLAVISGGGHLPGMPPAPTGKAQAVSALEGLRTKGVVDEQGRVTPFGMVPVKAVEQYWRADRHVFINQLKASVNEDGAITVLHPAGDDWNLSRMSPAGLMVALLEAYPWLCGGGPDTPAGSWEPLTLQQWADDRAHGSPGVVVVRDTSASKRQSTIVAYDMRGETGFAYDLDRSEGCALPLWQIRIRLADLIGFQPGDGKGGSHA